jgi:hypothetical protein
MRKEIAIELQALAKVVEERFSKHDREMNFNKEEFKIEKIIPSSDHSASVVFSKSSGKLGVAFFYYQPNGAGKGWKYFFPTDSHITGMRAFEYHKLNAEEFNFDKNFI